jgi:limonene-1,2-epoxide hydrolase
MAMDDEQRTIAFFEQWGVSFDAAITAFVDNFSNECVWEQRPLAVTTGPDEAIGFMRRAQRGMGLETIDVDVLHMSSDGTGVVHTERVDHLKRKDGSLIVSVPVAGVLEWHDGKIVAWREYFDSATFVGRAVPGIVGNLLGGLWGS